MKKIITMLICTAMLTGCTKGEDGDSSMSNVNAPSDMPYNGAFEINWTVDGQTVGTSTLEWMYTANILSLPHDWLHQQLFPGQQVTLLSDDVAQIWALHLSPTGYSDDNNYFAIENTHYEQFVSVGGQRLTYDVCFSQRRSTAICNRVTGFWTGVAPIDSIVIRDEDNRVDHRPVVVSVKRYSPAVVLAFNTTKRIR